MRQALVAGLVVLAFGMGGCSTGGSDATSSPMPSSASPAQSPALTPPTSNSLQLQGQLATGTSQEITGGGRGCGFGPPLIFSTNAMRLSDGRIVRVAFSISAQGSSAGTYSATSPLQQYGFTPLTLGVASNAATGAGNRINAASGEVTVRRADAANGLFYGTVDAQFADGTRLTGRWLCHVGE
ncbi:MAG TPA: hypothetical protein VGV87_04180 [Blastocatellia bacterium]|nr:hypothetical protein [Blastocatellia bacterium]